MGDYRDVDWANTATAQANRRRKADRLAAAAAWCGALDVDELAGPTADADVRAAVLAGAKVRSASEATWDVVAQVLTDLAPTVLTPGAPNPCGCTPHPVTGVLYESLVFAPGHGATSSDPQPRSGWLCRHGGRAPDPAPTEQLDPLADPVPDPMEGWDDGREPAWDDVARAAGLVDRRASSRVNHHRRAERVPA